MELGDNEMIDFRQGRCQKKATMGVDTTFLGLGRLRTHTKWREWEWLMDMTGSWLGTRFFEWVAHGHELDICLSEMQAISVKSMWPTSVHHSFSEVLVVARL